MYIRLNPTTSTSSASINPFMSAIYNIVVLEQTIAQQNSSYVNTGTSFISGSRPTSGIYFSDLAPTNYDTIHGSSNNGYWWMKKKHYATTQGSASYLPTRSIGCSVGYHKGSSSSTYYSYDLGWRFAMGSYNRSNRYPYNSGSSSIPSVWSNYYPGNNYNGAHASNRRNWVSGYRSYDFSAVHVIANDTTFMCIVQNTGTSTSIDQGWFMVSDLEHNPTYDHFAFGGNAQYCPTICSWAVQQNVMENSTPTASSSNEYAFGVGNPQYLDKFGTYRNTQVSDTSNYYHWGSQTTQYGDYPDYSPQPRRRVHKLQGPSGESLHQLMPLQYCGGSDATDLQSDPRMGRVMNVYRTSDSEFNNGDVIVDGSTRYRVFKCHKTGTNSQADAIDNACYAFPEDSIAFS